VAAIPEVLRALGVNPAEVLAEAGLERSLFDDGDNTISYAARGHLFGLCVARTGCGHFGLLVGQRGGLSSLGLVGFLVQQSQTVGTALRNLVRYSHLHVRGAATNLAVRDGSAILGYAAYQARIEAADQVGDGAMAMGLNIMRELCGPEWKPTEVLFAHREPEDVRPFRQFFRAPLRFDAGQYALVFSDSWLNRRPPRIDPELRHLLQKQVDELDARYREDFPEQLRRVLRSALPTGHATESQIAALFALHPRTLHRRLSSFGTSFRDLVAESRYEYARQMLRDSRMSMGQIAEMLGYSEPSAFTRAFRRWSGTSPGRWRGRTRAKRTPRE
jgi:AraC-like DNA-binding protein